MKVISLINMKGGVGKTTCTVAIGYELAESFNKKVLIIDLDPQTNASLILLEEESYKNIDSKRKTIADVFSQNSGDLLGEKKSNNLLNNFIIENVWETNNGKLDLIPSSIRLFEEQQILAKINYSEDFIKEKLQNIPSENYDICLIDCPPDFDKLVISALEASNHYIIPLRPDYLSQQGVVVLSKKLNTIKSHLKSSLLGIIINLIPTTRGGFYKQIVGELEKEFNGKILGKVNEYQAYSKWPSAHSPLSKKDREPFISISKEILGNIPDE